MKRMTDERLAEIESLLSGSGKEGHFDLQELLQALKAERAAFELLQEISEEWEKIKKL